MAKNASMKNKGDALVFQVSKDEPVNIKITGSGEFRIAFQAEVGAPGSGSWRDIQSWSWKKEDKDKREEVFSYSNAHEELQALRLVVKAVEKGASISASMEVPAEEEVKEEEPKPRELKTAEFVPASEASVEAEEEKRKAEAEARVAAARPVKP